jgi:phosphohistidine phosphatase
MKTLLLLRHAKSSWDDPEIADHDRPLAKRGRRDAPRMGALLREEELTPDLILSSTARRARKTAEAVAEESGYAGEIELHDEFYPGAPQDYLSALQKVWDEYQRVMVVGHNPGLEELLETLTGETLHLPTAALAQVTLPIEHWIDLDEETEGTLINLWRPR